ncbi:MAG: sulfotransferase domain-containing protein [Bacillus sp. (in: firmicutes)]
MTHEKLLLPKIFINSVPKSGTNLLIQIIKGIPIINQNRSFWANNHDEVLKIQSGEVVYSHLPYDSLFSKELQNRSIKQVFIYRDLRDVAVSMVHFINDVFYDHPLYPVFQKRIVTFEEQLNAVILGVDLIGEENNNKWGVNKHYPGIYKESHMIYEWKNDSTLCSIRYEDLINKSSQDSVILSIIDYLWENLKELKIDKYGLLNLMKNNIEPAKSWTFRQGKTGGWREEFTEKHKRIFKEITGNFLIEFDYEKNNNW